MTKKRGRTAAPLHLTIGNDPTTWRYATLAEALRASLPLLAEAIMNQTCNSSSGSITTTDVGLASTTPTVNDETTKDSASTTTN